MIKTFFEIPAGTSMTKHVTILLEEVMGSWCEVSHFFPLTMCVHVHRKSPISLEQKLKIRPVCKNVVLQA